MAEPNTTPAPETPTPTPPTEASPPAAALTTEQPAPAQPATPAIADHMIPKARFDEINTKLKEAEKALKAIEATKAEALKAQQDAEAKTLAEQGEWKKLYETQQAKVTEADEKTRLAEAAAEQAKLDLIRVKVGARYGLPEVLVSRLQGATEAEMDADAVLVAATIGKPVIPVNTDGAAGTNGRTPTPAKSPQEIKEQAAKWGVGEEYLTEVFNNQARR